MDRARARAAADILTGTVFVALLAMPALDLVARIDRTKPPEEKRTLAPAPALPPSWRAAAALPAAFDAYLGDHFGFRPLLIRLHARVAVRWLGVAPSPTVEVIVGKKGWLYFTGNDALASIEGRNLLSESELAAWTRAFRQRGRWLERRGSHYLIVVAPDKATIYPEYLPGWVRPARHGTRLDQLLNALKGCPEVTVVDVRPVVRKFDWLGPVYSRTDTHWNMIGAYAAYEAIMSGLSKWFPAVRATPPTGFALSWGNDQGGDLAVMAGIDGLVSERFPWIARKAGNRWQAVPPGEYAGLRPWPHLEEPVVTTCPAREIPRGLVLRDSFLGAVVPLLSEHFGRAVYLWYQEFEPPVMDCERPSVVIQEVAERLLGSLDVGNPPAVTAATGEPEAKLR